MPYVVNTASAGTDYNFEKTLPNGLSQVVKTISINGGANVASKNLVTPEGVLTEVSGADLELLKTHPVFKKEQEMGFVKIVHTEKVNVKGMEAKDASAPVVKSDAEERGFRPSTGIIEV